MNAVDATVKVSPAAPLDELMSSSRTLHEGSRLKEARAAWRFSGLATARLA
jgi:hypothetical protein